MRAIHTLPVEGLNIALPYYPSVLNPNGITAHRLGPEATIQLGLSMHAVSPLCGHPRESYDYYLGIDMDPSVGITHQVVDALSFFADNSYGTGATLNGQGVEGSAAVFASMNTIAQQSQNIVFYGQDANAQANYDYELYAVKKGSGPGGKKRTSVTISVVVGSGGPSVQDLVNNCAATATDHGDYVHCVKDLVKYLQESGVVSKKEGQALIKDASHSDIGK